MACMAVISFLTTIGRAEEPVQDTTDRNMTDEEQVREGFGIGVIVEEPAGLGAKKCISDTRAIDGAAAWSFADFNAFQLHVDHLSHNYDLIKTTELPGQISGYYGIGGRIKLKGSNEGKGNGSMDQNARMGVRVPFGLSYTLKENPVELFAELIPLLDVVPETKLGIGVGVGARYYFALR